VEAKAFGSTSTSSPHRHGGTLQLWLTRRRHLFSRQCRTQCGGSASAGGQISTKSGNGSVSGMASVEVGVDLRSLAGSVLCDDGVEFSVVVIMTLFT
jgi:hypothetical protein